MRKKMLASSLAARLKGRTCHESLILYLFIFLKIIIKFLFLESDLHPLKIMLANGAHDKISFSFPTLTTILLK